MVVGDAVELRWIATRHPPLSTHLVFISSSGAIAGGQPCGPNGASLHCTTCGEEPGWLTPGSYEFHAKSSFLSQHHHRSTAGRACLGGLAT